ncbi:MAG: GTP-binding protein, partial [Pseudomonadota bacterium]
NHLLRNAGGGRIMVMVNDFGDLDIDADLLESADEDTITLSNGCICCTMGAELISALSSALDRRPRPDRLVIEASGVAEPAKIAAAAHAEPDMRYNGVVSMVDAANFETRLADKLIGAQVAAQISAADMVLVTKTDLADAPLEALRGLTRAPVLDAPRGAGPIGMILDQPERTPRMAQETASHDVIYKSWSTTGGIVDPDALRDLLRDPPPGLYRLKGRVADTNGDTVEAHLVGRVWEVSPALSDAALPAASSRAQSATRLVAIGLATAFDPDEMARRWRAILRD